MALIMCGSRFSAAACNLQMPLHNYTKNLPILVSVFVIFNLNLFICFCNKDGIL